MQGCVHVAVAVAVAAVLVGRGSCGVDVRHLPVGDRIGTIGAAGGYSDQPYCAVREDGAWVCVVTVSPGHEGSGLEKVVSLISSDRGKTWSEPVDVVPGAAVQYAYATLLPAPATKMLYTLYVINSDNVTHLPSGQPTPRADMMGHFRLKYSRDGGEHWSSESYEVPVRATSIDANNSFHGKVMMHWNVDKGIVVGSEALVAFSKIGTYCVNPPTSAWVLHSPNLGSATDPSQITWTTQPAGDTGIRMWSYPHVAISEEPHIVRLPDGSGYYAVFRTINGYLGAAKSATGAHWEVLPSAAHYGSESRTPLFNPRGPITPRAFTMPPGSNGAFLMLYYNHIGINDYQHRNPYWLVPGWQVGPEIMWGQPEIALYESPFDGSERGAGYPDFIETADGHIYIAETNKSDARVHAVSDKLSAMLFSQRQVSVPVTEGLVFNVTAPPARATFPTPQLPDFSSGGGIGLGLTVSVSLTGYASLKTGDVLLTSSSNSSSSSMGRSFTVSAVTREWAAQPLLQFSLSDGTYAAHVVISDKCLGLFLNASASVATFVFDAGARVLYAVGNGVFCTPLRVTADMATFEVVPKELADVSSKSMLVMAPQCGATVTSVKVYNRALLTTEALSDYRAQQL